MMITPQNLEDRDYKLVHKNDSHFYSLQLLTGKYKDVIFTYGKVNVKEDKELDQCKLSFDWRLEEKPDALTEDLNKSEEFQNYIGDILRDILIESKNAREYTDNNTENINSE